MTWTPPPPPTAPSFSAGQWVRILRRGVAVAFVVFGGLAVLLLLRLVERPIAGAHRPVTPHITVAVCRTVLRIMGLRVATEGQPMIERGALVANHATWLDIFVLNSTQPLYFVSKSEVAGWPGIGWLARATGTMFIRRDPREAAAQTRALSQRLAQNHRLLFFPEGTSTDGAQVLPFKPTLFAAFFDKDAPPDLHIQPISLRYHAPLGQRDTFYGWWGDMDFASSLAELLAMAPQGGVTITHHAPVPVAAYAGRKALARALEVTVRDGHAQAR